MLAVIFEAALLVADLAFFLILSIRFGQNRSVRQYFALAFASFFLLCANSLRLAAATILARIDSPPAVLMLTLVAVSTSLAVFANVLSDLAILDLLRKWVGSMRESIVPGEAKNTSAAAYTRYIYIFYPVAAVVFLALMLTVIFVDNPTVELITSLLSSVYGLVCLLQFAVTLWLWLAVRNVVTTELAIKRHQMVTIAFLSFFYSSSVYEFRPLMSFSLWWYLRLFICSYNGALVGITVPPRQPMEGKRAEIFNVPAAPQPAYVGK